MSGWVSHLQAPVQCALDGHTLAGVCSVGGNRGDERVQLILLLLQLLHQTLDRPLGEGLALPTLAVTHEAVDDAQARVVTGGGAGDRHTAPGHTQKAVPRQTHRLLRCSVTHHGHGSPHQRAAVSHCG